jgi:hypothetical protein
MSEPIESCCSADGICPHALKIDPITDLKDGEEKRFADAVETIACGTPKGAFDPNGLHRIGVRTGGSVVVKAILVIEKSGAGVLRIVQDAIETAIETVTQVVYN